MTIKTTLLLTLLFTLRLAVAAQGIGPRIQFEFKTHDIGEIPWGGKAEYTFPFKNVGDEPLILTTVKSSCGCLVPYWDKEVIPPGSESEIRAKYDSKRVGPINKTITVQSNDTTQPVIVLYVKGRVLEKTGIVFQSECLENLRIPQGSTQPVLFVYRNVTKDMLVIQSSQNSKAVQRLDWNIPGMDNGVPDTLRVWFDTKRMGPFSNSIILQTTDTLRPMVYLHFEGEIVE